jgi:hypothetical protein
MATQDTPDGSHALSPATGEEVIVWDKTLEEYEMKAQNLVGPGVTPASVTGRTWEEMKSYPPGPAKLDAGAPVLLAVLKYAKWQEKKASDPVTYEDLLEIAKLIRERNINLEDDGSV